MTEKYTPSKGDYIRVQGNKQYLPVPNRVQWFRGEHPTWTIRTSIVELDWEPLGYAIMRAEILDDTGRLIASGMKTETRKGFADFVEKAETGAVGRALARAGYGTEDALDLEGDRYADAPIEQPGRRGGSPSSPNGARVQNQYRRAELAALMKEHHLTVDAVEHIADLMSITERPMSDESMDLLIAAIEQPETAERAHAVPADSPEAGSSAPTSGSTPAGEGARALAPATPAATEDEGDPPATSSEPSAALDTPEQAPIDRPANIPARRGNGNGAEDAEGVHPRRHRPEGPASAAPTLDDVLAVSGGEVIPPKRGRKGRTVEEAIADAKQKAAKADEPEQESLAMALGGPES